MRGAFGLALVLASTIVLSACAEKHPDGSAQQSPSAEAPVWNPGAEWAFRWGRPGGSGTYVTRISREETVDGITCYVATIGRTETYFRKVDLASYMEKVAGVVDWRQTPPRTGYAWPLVVGKRWEQSYTQER